MQRIFAMDGKVVNFLNKVADLVLLNILWLICCVPIVTIGASTTAFSYVLLKMVRDEESYLFSTFFRVFKENFKQSTVVWVIFILIGAVLYLDFYVVGIMTGGVKSILLTLFFMILFLVAATMFYVFPVMAFFENSTKKVFKNSFYMALAHLPYTLLIVVINLCPVILLIFGNFIAAGFVDAVIGFALAGWINAHIFRKLFDRYLKKTETAVPVEERNKEGSSYGSEI